MHPPDADTVLVRYGEIGVKSTHVQARMETVLQKNLVAILRDRGFDEPVEREHTRLYVETCPARIESVTDAVTDCFGVVSASPSRQVEPTEEAILEELKSTAAAHYEGGTFAVRVRRAGPSSTHPFTSVELEEAGGSAIWTVAKQTGYDPEVDLEAPDMTFFVEVRPRTAYVFLEKRAGPGGLPLGTQEPLVALVSGGIDSPVAAWEVMKRGSPIVPLYVDLGQYGGVDHRLRAEETVRTLREYAPNFDLEFLVAPGGETIDQIVAETRQHRMLVLRRFMLRVAECVANEQGAVGIVTGEAIGQKSSQTTAGLATTSAATTLPVHRPLLSIDKTEITRRAVDIGTYHDATIDAGCNRIAPETPATKPSPGAVESAEPTDIHELAEAVAEQVERVDLQSVQ